MARMRTSDSHEGFCSGRVGESVRQRAVDDLSPHFEWGIENEPRT